MTFDGAQRSMEASGDALVRMGLGHAALGIRIALFVMGKSIPMRGDDTRSGDGLLSIRVPF